MHSDALLLYQVSTFARSLPPMTRSLGRFSEALGRLRRSCRRSVGPAVGGLLAVGRWTDCSDDRLRHSVVTRQPWAAFAGRAVPTSSSVAQLARTPSLLPVDISTDWLLVKCCFLWEKAQQQAPT